MTLCLLVHRSIKRSIASTDVNLPPGVQKVSSGSLGRSAHRQTVAKLSFLPGMRLGTCLGTSRNGITCSCSRSITAPSLQSVHRRSRETDMISPLGSAGGHASFHLHGVRARVRFGTDCDVTSVRNRIRVRRLPERCAWSHSQHGVAWINLDAFWDVRVPVADAGDKQPSRNSSAHRRG